MQLRPLFYFMQQTPIPKLLYFTNDNLLGNRSTVGQRTLTPSI